MNHDDKVNRNNYHFLMVFMEDYACLTYTDCLCWSVVSARTKTWKKGYQTDREPTDVSDKRENRQTGQAEFQTLG